MSVSVPATNEAAAPAVAPPVVLKLGKQSAKKIRQLRKGKGKLLDKVIAAIAHLQANGTVLPGAQPVVVVVKEEREGMLFKL